MNIPCQWWLEPCVLQATTLILACCEQGHIHERLLCNADTKSFTYFINSENCMCNTCGLPLIKYLTGKPENHWDLTRALEKHTPIMITFEKDTPLNLTWIPFTGEDHTPYGNYPIQNEKIPEAYKNLSQPADVYPDNPITSWIRKNLKKK